MPSHEYRVLVCGGRKFGDMAAMTRVLDGLYPRPTLIIHGAARGADECAWRWACKHFVPDRAFPADWERHGRAAGPIRNRKMLEEGKPHLVIAFPGGRGTHDMVQQAKTAGLPVLEAARIYEPLRLHPA